MDIRTKCQLCGKEHVVHLTDDQTMRYKKYLSGNGHIQDLLPDLSADVREMLISGVCPACFAKLEEGEEE